MLLVTANGGLPGQVLTAGPGGAVQVALKGELTARDRARLCHAVCGGSTGAVELLLDRGAPVEAFLAWLDPGNFDGDGRQRTRLPDRTRPLLKQRG